jgi:hypothetical protein
MAGVISLGIGMLGVAAGGLAATAGAGAITTTLFGTGAIITANVILSASGGRDRLLDNITSP